MARDIVRGIGSQWVRDIYSIALIPDAVFYLRIGIDDLLPRVVFSRGFDYWESGMDLFPGQDFYEGFCHYQAALLEEFDRLAEEYKFEIVEASADAHAVCEQLKRRILEIVEPEHKATPGAKMSEVLVHSLADRIMAKLTLGAPQSELENGPIIPSLQASATVPVAPLAELRLRRKNRLPA
jgi:hypothetical protein